MNVAIIGGGLSGLLCALMLEKKGYTPTIYERLHKVGGVLDSFKRKKILFDIGFHYSGALSKNQYLYNVMKELGLLEKLKLESYKENFDTLFFNNEEYIIPVGSKIFKEKLQFEFPKESENIEVFFNNCYKSSTISSNPENFLKIDTRSVGDVLKDIKNIKLRKIFLHFTIFYTTALYEDASFDFYAKIFINMLDGTKKIDGGGKAIIKVLKESLKSTTIKLKSEVSQIIQDEKGVHSIIANGELFKHNNIISTVHPKVTMNMFNSLDKKQIRYKRHIDELVESPSFTSIFCLIDADIESNLYYYSEQDKDFISILPSRKYENQTVVTILAGSNYKEYIHLNDETYKDKKELELQYNLERIKKISGFKNIEVFDSSTPMTKQYYSNGIDGSIYGIMCSAKQKSLSVLMPRTRIKNLYFAGENIIAPGLIGAFLGAEILMHYFEEIK